MNWVSIIIIILIGIVALILDFIVIPGTFVSFIGGAFMVAGIVMGYVFYGALVGNIILVATIIVTITAIVLMLRSKTWKKLMLNTKIESKVNEVNTNVIVEGVQGVSISRLAPTGTAQFADELVEVTSVLGFVDPQTPVQVIAVEGSKVLVKVVENYTVRD
jgi:membrane-bound ClpP family serine protease